MFDSTAHGDRLITRSEIGSLAGVARPTVTSWCREPGFPTPQRAVGADLFHQSAVLAWLDARPVPQRFRGAAEHEGVTFGDRARRALTAGDRSRTVRPSVIAEREAEGGPERHAARDRRRVHELMGHLADRVRGAGSVIDYMNLLLALLFLRGAGRLQWDGIVRESDVGTGSDGAAALLHHIGSAADAQLTRLGVLPGMRETLRRLEPRTYDDLKRVVQQVGELGPNAFRLILDEYEMRAGLRSGEFFTPRGVVRVMTALAFADRGPGAPGSIYDPYSRGGEILVEAAAYCRAQGAATTDVYLCGSSHGRDAARLGSMNLALQGFRPNVKLTRGAPWADAGGFQESLFDYVLTNPPFNMNDSAGEARCEGEWAYGPPPVGNDNFAYVQYVLGSLREGGSAAVVMPVKAGNSANRAESEIRRNMVERGVVECVLALPDRLFSSTPVPVSVWFLNHPARSVEKVRFLDARSLGTMHKGKRVLDEADCQAVLDAYVAAASPEVSRCEGRDRGVLSAVVSRETIRARGYSLNPIDHFHAAQRSTVDVDAAVMEAWQEMERCERDLKSPDAAAERLRLEPPAPPAWRTVMLSEICDIQAGPSYTLLRDAQRTPEGQVPLVFPRHLSQGRIEHTDEERVPMEVAQRLRGFQLEPEDIVCIRTGAIGPPALVREREAGWLMSTNLLRLRVRQEAQADPQYLARYLCRPDSVEWVRARATATGAPSISAKSLGNQPVVLPSLHEQRRITGELAVLEAQEIAHRRFADAVSAARAALAERLMTGGHVPSNPPFNSGPILPSTHAEGMLS